MKCVLELGGTYIQFSGYEADDIARALSLVFFLRDSLLDIILFANDGDWSVNLLRLNYHQIC